jgi:hypothetical protein
MDPPPAPHAACAIEALDDPLLLRIICATIDGASGGGGGAVEEAQQAALATEAPRTCGDGAEDDAWHPAHLARLACVSRCVT